MRGDPQVELRGAVLVGRRVVPVAQVETDTGSGPGTGNDPGVNTDAATAGGPTEIVSVTGLLVRVDSRGLTVEGPRPNVVHTVSWQRIRSVDAGKPATFDDGNPARSIEVELDDRSVQFIVPADVLGENELGLLDEIVSRHLETRSRVQREESQMARDSRRGPGRGAASSAADLGCRDASQTI